MDNKLMSDVFDLKDQSDLPDTLVDVLVCNKMNNLDTKILNLFKEKHPLSLDEIMVALFRKHKIQEPRTKINQRVYNLIRTASKPLMPVKGRRGIFTIREQIK